VEVSGIDKTGRRLRHGRDKGGDVLLRINDFPIDSPEKASVLCLPQGQSGIKLDLIRTAADVHV
jgi:hypothetical protein